MSNLFRLIFTFIVLILKPSLSSAIENHDNLPSQTLIVGQKSRLIRKNGEQKKKTFKKEAQEKIKELEKILKAKLKNSQVTRRDRVCLQLEFCEKIDQINFNLYKVIIEINKETEDLLNEL